VTLVTPLAIEAQLAGRASWLTECKRPGDAVDGSTSALRQVAGEDAPPLPSSVAVDA
jgi:hypothetical protein